MDGATSKYHFTMADDGGLLSRNIKLNGVLLALNSDEVPAFEAVQVAPPTRPVYVSPLSYGFIKVDTAAPALCLVHTCIQSGILKQTKSNRAQRTAELAGSAAPCRTSFLLARDVIFWPKI